MHYIYYVFYVFVITPIFLLTTAITTLPVHALQTGAGINNIKNKTIIFTGIIPVKYFVDRIVFETKNVEVEALIGPAQEHETYSPTLQQMKRLSQSKLYFSIGLAFEKVLSKKLAGMYKNLKIVELYTPVLTHADEHADPHVWLDPLYMIKISKEITDAIKQIDPDKSNWSRYETNYKSLSNELMALHKELSKIKFCKSFMVYHEAFGHFAKLYNLKQMAIEKEGKEPSARDLGDIIKEAKKENVKFILTQRQYSQKQAYAIAKIIDAKVVDFDPMEYDYFQMMKKLGKLLSIK